MAKGRSNAGGGIRSRVVTQRPVRVGKGATRVNERGVSQIGQSLGDHITERRQTVDPVERVRAGAMGGMGNVPLGNTVAKNVGAGGPGAGRNVMHCGSQGVHGSPNPGNPRPAGRDMLAEFGRESPIVSERKR